MYVCTKHGNLEKGWCNPCKEIIECDCRDQIYTRFKDQIYECDDGERTITMRLYHCATCGKPSHVEI